MGAAASATLSSAQQASTPAAKAAEPQPETDIRTPVQNSRWLAFLSDHAIHPKLQISDPGDHEEREADAAADRVMQMAVPGGPRPSISSARPGISRACSACAKEDEDQHKVARKASAPTGIAPAQTAAVAATAAVAGSGVPLGRAERAWFEPRFGRDLSDVRIHTGAHAQVAAAGIAARAYTYGRNIAFAAGQYRPETEAGRRLIAHELAHVLQNDPAADATELNRAPADRILREAIDNRDFKMCYQVVKGKEKFRVDKGGLIISAFARWVDKEEDDAPRAADPDYGATTYRISVDDDSIWDSDRGGCDFPIGKSASRQWLNLPPGEYRLIVSVGDHNQHFCLDGQLALRQEAGLSGSSCTQAPRGPMEIVHDALMLAGMIPALGVVPDAINTGIYVIQGEWKDAGISALAIVPFLGDGAQAVRMGEKLVVKVTDKGIIKVGEHELAQGLKEAKAANAAKEAEAAATARKAIAGASEVKLTLQEYEAALKQVFPSKYLDETARLVDEIGQGAARRAMQNPRFVAAMEQGNMTLAGTFFHTAAKEEARAVATAGRLPPGWVLEAEKTMKAGKGGSRLDIFLEGPAAEVVEFDWKTTGKSALSTKSVDEMAKHAGEVRVKIGKQLTTQESVSWMDYVRPLL